MNKNVLAIDFGASSGRAILGQHDGRNIVFHEIHRFSNDPVMIQGTFYWDILRLFHEIKQSIILSKKYGALDSIAVDTWGVDFALLDKDGHLLENPVHYRDTRTRGMIPHFSVKMPSKRLYEITGIQPLEHNTLYQLLSLKENRPDILQRADKLLMIPDLFGYFLSGNIRAELSAASTTQLINPDDKEWSDEIIQAIGINRSLFPPLLPSGQPLGTLSESLCQELGVAPCKVYAVCSHDTQSAMAAVPSQDQDFLFLSSGTWSLLGTELESPITTSAARQLGLSNEVGFDNKISFLKNINGLWLIQESRRQWIREGINYSFADLERLARNAPPFCCFINPDDPVFDQAGDIPSAVREFCRKTGQSIPQSAGEIMRCIYESLALRYRMAIKDIEYCTGKKYPSLYIVGGGTKDQFLSTLTANSSGYRVVSGPTEATAIGNVLVQLIASGEIKSLKEARKMIAHTESLRIFEPEKQLCWDKAALRFQEIFAYTKN